MTHRQLLLAATQSLAAAGCDTPRLDAEALLLHAANLNRTQLFLRLDEESDAAVQGQFESMVLRRAGREPVAYIVGEREFWSRNFIVTPDVLIPRPETEHLIETVQRLFPDPNAPLRLCDIGTGSGCLPVTLACEYPEARLLASDISPAALAVAQRNGERHQVSDRLDWRCGDLYEPLRPGDGPFDAILSNPPYVSLSEYGALAPELAFEPRGALTDEADGLSLLRRLVNGAPEWLKPGGWLLLETGPCGLPAGEGEMALIEEIRDLAGHLRAGLYRREA